MGEMRNKSRGIESEGGEVRDIQGHTEYAK